MTFPEALKKLCEKWPDKFEIDPKSSVTNAAVQLETEKRELQKELDEHRNPVEGAKCIHRGQFFNIQRTVCYFCIGEAVRNAGITHPEELVKFIKLAESVAYKYYGSPFQLSFSRLTAKEPT